MRPLKSVFVMTGGTYCGRLIEDGYPVLVNDTNLTLRAKDHAVELLGKEHVVDMDIRMTAEDFAWFTNEYPAMLYRLGVKDPSGTSIYPLHTNRFIASEESLHTGMSLMAWLSLQLLERK